MSDVVKKEYGIFGSGDNLLFFFLLLVVLFGSGLGGFDGCFGGFDNSSLLFFFLLLIILFCGPILFKGFC